GAELKGRPHPPPPPVGQGPRLRVLIVVNAENLRNATAEADAIEKALRERLDVDVIRLDGADATVKSVTDALASGFFDVLHYAGHASFNEANPEQDGLRLVGGTFTGQSLPRTAAPRLVFLSACESGRLRRDVNIPPTPNGLSLAETLLRNGVAAFVGTFIAVDDGAARTFATTVHTQLAAGKRLGFAVRTARKALYDAQSPDWGNFMLFGDNRLVL